MPAVDPRPNSIISEPGAGLTQRREHERRQRTASGESESRQSADAGERPVADCTCIGTPGC